MRGNEPPQNPCEAQHHRARGPHPHPPRLSGLQNRHAHGARKPTTAAAAALRSADRLYVPEDGSRSEKRVVAQVDALKWATGELGAFLRGASPEHGWVGDFEIRVAAVGWLEVAQVQRDLGRPFGVLFLRGGGCELEENARAPRLGRVGWRLEVDGRAGVAQGGEVLGLEEQVVCELVTVRKDGLGECEVRVDGAVSVVDGRPGRADCKLQRGVQACRLEELGGEGRARGYFVMTAMPCGHVEEDGRGLRVFAEDGQAAGHTDLVGLRLCGGVGGENADLGPVLWC